MKKLLLMLSLIVLGSCSTPTPEVEENVGMACWPNCMYDDAKDEWGAIVEGCEKVFEGGNIKDIAVCLGGILVNTDVPQAIAQLTKWSVECGVKCIFDAEEKAKLHQQVIDVCDEYQVEYPENLGDLLK